MPAGITSFLSPLELRQLDRLSLASRYVVEGNLAGRHRTHRQGSGTEFADHRGYMPGDDLKRLDWKVLGRTERYYVRRYEDETNLRVYFVLDRSGSMGYGSGTVSKFDYARRLIAALGYVVLRGRDSAGLCIYSGGVHFQTEALNSFRHLNGLLERLMHTGPVGPTATAPALHRLADSIRRRALIVLVSDLMDENARDLIHALAHFRRLRHDVIVFQVLDPAELDPTRLAPSTFVDMETDERLVADPRMFAKEYRRIFGEFIENYRKACREMNIDHRIVNTSQPMDLFVRACLEERARRT